MHRDRYTVSCQTVYNDKPYRCVCISKSPVLLSKVVLLWFQVATLHNAGGWILMQSPLVWERGGLLGGYISGTLTTATLHARLAKYGGLIKISICAAGSVLRCAKVHGQKEKTHTEWWEMMCFIINAFRWAACPLWNPSQGTCVCVHQDDFNTTLSVGAFHSRCHWRFVYRHASAALRWLNGVLRIARVSPDCRTQIDFRPCAITQLWHSNLVKWLLSAHWVKVYLCAISGHRWTQFNYHCGLLRSDCPQRTRQHGIPHTHRIHLN